MRRPVLVADDEPLVLELLADILKEMSCEVWMLLRNQSVEWSAGNFNLVER
jgi:CheY-like chemotaxis protein